MTTPAKAKPSNVPAIEPMAASEVLEDIEVLSEPTVAMGGSGQKLGRYRLCFEIAAGGMATVFLARAEGPGGFEKLVALKRIHPHLATNRAFVDMFLDEARIASQITHPNVCTVFDFGEASGTYYIAMEYLVGEAFTRVLRAMARRPEKERGPRTQAFLVKILADACEGLHAAHELRDAKGELLHVVHRDVSPHNLFVTYDGGVRVVDFGIASATNRIHETTTGQVKGKYGYMAPEQVRGKPMDRRADVWALGVVLWECLTLRRLFRRETEMETLFAVASDPIPAPSELSPTVPPELDTIVLKALARDPADRYTNAREMGRDLLKFLARRGETVGLPDLAEWMDVLFPEGRARKRQLVELARQSDGPVPAVHDGRSEASDSASLSFAPHTESKVRNKIELRDRGTEATPKGTGKRVASFVAGALGAVIVGALGARLLDGDTDRGEERAARDLPAVESAARAPASVEVPVAVTAPVAAPVSAPVAVPVSDPVAAPIAAPVAAPVPAPVSAPVAVPVVAPVASSPPTRTPNRPAKVARPAAPRATGFVQIATPGGWASVYEGRRRLAETTPTRIELSAGRHTLEFRPSGRGPGRTVVVEVPPSGVARAVVRLD